VDPCIPPEWKHYKVRRSFRGSIYEFEVRNPTGVQTGVQELWLDGRRICLDTGPREKRVPPFGDGKVHHVRAVLGPAS